jgi:hypothetical protein
MPQIPSVSTWRAHPHRVNGYLYALYPDVIFSASVNQATFTYPVAALTYDNVTVNDYTYIREGMTVKISSAAGAFKNWARVRKAPTDTILYIGAIPSGDIVFEDDDLIDVLDDYRPWAKIPKIDASNPLAVVFYKDYDIAYTNQGVYPPPVCNVGNHIAGFVDPDSEVLYDTCDTDYYSYPMAYGATVDSYLNEIGDGSFTEGDSTSGSFLAEYPAGKRWVHVTITDSNGNTHTAHKLVAACERTGANAPIQARLASMRGDVSAGWSAEFVIQQDDGSKAVIPEGTLVIYFEEEQYGDTAGSLNSYDKTRERSGEHKAQVKFVGWVTGNDERIEAETDDQTVKATGPLGIMQTMPLFSQTVSYNNSASVWHQMAYLTLFRYIWYLLHWHSNLLDICDLILPDWYSAYPYHRFDVSAGTLGTTVDQMAQYVNANLTCDRQGRLLIPQNPQFMTGDVRDTITTTVSLDDSDITDMSINEADRYNSHWVRASGLLASSSTIRPYLSIAPGKSPGQGGMEESLDNQLVTGQDDLNIRSGRQYGIRNTKYSGMSATINNGGTIVDPAWREWIEYTLPASRTKRGITFNAGRFLLKDVSYNYDAELGASSESWSLEAETFGTPGETIPIPEYQMDNTEYVGLPPHRPIYTTQYDPRMRYYLTPRDPMAVYLMTQAYIARSRNFFSSSPTWEVMSVPSTIHAEEFDYWKQFVIDPYNPKNAAYLVYTNSDIASYAVYYVTYSNGSSAQWQWSNIASDSGLSTADVHVAPSPCMRGALWISSYTGTNKVYITRRSSYGGTLTTAEVGIDSNGLHNFYIATGYRRNSFSTSSVAVAYPIDDPPYYEMRAFRSIDAGATFTPEWYLPGATGEADVRGIEIPYHNTASDDYVYIGSSGSAVGLRRRETDASYTRLSDGTWDINAFNYGSCKSFVVYPQDRNYIYAIGYASGNAYLKRTVDGGANWDNMTFPGGGTTFASENYLAGIYVWPYDPNYVVLLIYSGTNKGFWRCHDFVTGGTSPTWVNAIGNYETAVGLLGGTGMIISDFAITTVY